MEEVGTQVAAPLYIHQNIAGRFHEGGLIGKKRSGGYYRTNNQLQDSQPGGWNPSEWGWDSARFVAKPKGLEPDLLRLGTVNVVRPSFNNKQGFDLSQRAPVASRSIDDVDDDERGGNSLRLGLGGAGAGTSNSNSGEDPASVSRPNKKVRSGSPGSGGGNYPMCQVDGCTEDLSKSKDYHRRHKVCEFHSKATKALVGKDIQRFCQQCSRFHPLSEFDEGKRSCRRRLAGHNRRRRKTQPEDAVSLAAHTTDSNSSGTANLDIVNLLTVLARGQGNAENNVPVCSSMPDKSQLIQILSKINSLPRQSDVPTGPVNPTGSTKNVFEQAALSQSNADANIAGRSNMDLLAALSATLAASTSDALAFTSQRSSPSAHMDKKRTSFANKDTNSDVYNKPALDLPSVGGERSSSSYQSPTEHSDGRVQDTRVNIPLQLFSASPGDDSPPNAVSLRKYLSSDSCSPPDERSHASSVPITRKLFPLGTTSEYTKTDRMSIDEDVDLNVEASQTGTFASGMTLELFNMGNRTVSNSVQSLPPQAGYTSSSGSDHSPPSFNSDPQKDRTGRILFKLFDKDPSHFPGALRTQIYNWLSNSPSEMESYIRPGCVVLSIYVSMSAAAWEKLEENFLQRVSALVHGTDSEFWRSGRFSVYIGRHLAFHKDGIVRVCKPWSTLNSPELFVVSPLAVVSGQDTSLVIRGRNLTSPGTKIHCTFMGGYSSQDVLGSADEGFSYDEIRLNDIKVHAAPTVLGRFFVEVENGVRGNTFPVIVANAKICQELRLLEREFDEEAKSYDMSSDDRTLNTSTPGSHEEVLHFLNELGWLFMRQMSPDIAYHDYMLHRCQYLLTFSIERDYCALVKTLLDIFVESERRTDGFSAECVEALAEMHLLHRAVKRRSKEMVGMLVHYSLPYGNVKKYIFPPNLSGPGGITPLHLAACTSGSHDIVDVLTDDPLEIGLHSWESVLDDNGLSPSAYAMMRNEHSINSLVAQKLVDRRNGQVRVSIANEILESSVPGDVKERSILQSKKKYNSCSKCAMVTYSRMASSRGVLHRPFIHSMLAIAAVCVCVCLFFKSMHVNSVSFMWENVDFGSI